MPGSAYTTIDHDAREQDMAVDTCEDFMASDARTRARVEHMERLALDRAFTHGQIAGEEGPRSPEEQEEEALDKIRSFGAEGVATNGLGRAAAGLVDSLHGRPILRQSLEREFEARLGVTMPRDPDDRSIFRDADGPTAEQELPLSEEPTHSGDYLPEDRFGLCAKAGTVVVLHFDAFHRGAPRLPKSLWRPMMKLKVSAGNGRPLADLSF